MGPFLKRYQFSLLVTLFVVIMAGYLMWGGEESGLPPEDPIVQETTPEPDIESPSIFTVGAGTNLIYQAIHNQCGHPEVLRQRTPSDELGLTIEELQAIYRDWTIEQTDLDVLLTAMVDGLCQSCQDKIYVGVHEGKVAVFNGDPGGEHWLREITDIPVEVLPVGEQMDLEAGIGVGSEEELLYILEGLMMY